MAIVITNGEYYVKRCTYSGERMNKTKNLSEAKFYYNVNVAQKKLLSMPGQLKGYYIFDTEGDEKGENKKRYQGKRRVYTKEERKFIYRKYEGKCALCGKKITYKELTLDHIKPIFVGGADELENIQASCYACNQFKCKRLNFRHGYKNPRPHFCNRSTLIIHI